MIELNKLSETIHEANVKKGFYDDPIETGTKLMLVVSELAEALEADRKGNKAKVAQFDILVESGHYGFAEAFKATIKDTFEDEIADAMIRLFDLAGFYKLDIEKHIALKLQYNATRPPKHGKKY